MSSPDPGECDVRLHKACVGRNPVDAFEDEGKTAPTGRNLSRLKGNFITSAQMDKVNFR